MYTEYETPGLVVSDCALETLQMLIFSGKKSIKLRKKLLKSTCTINNVRVYYMSVLVDKCALTQDAKIRENVEISMFSASHTRCDEAESY